MVVHDCNTSTEKSEAGGSLIIPALGIQKPMILCQSNAWDPETSGHLVI